MTPVLRAASLSRRWPAAVGVQDLNLEIGRGEVVGLLGRNGAGKSTALRLFAGLLQRDSGRLEMLGRDREAWGRTWQAHVGWLPERPPVALDASPLEALQLACSLRHASGEQARRWIDREVQAFALQDVLRRPFGSLSHGNRQRTGLAIAFLGNPDLLLLDEPASGLDPGQQSALQARIADATEAAVLLSSHQLDQVRACCGRVLLLEHGRLQRECTTQAAQWRVRLRQTVAIADWAACPFVSQAQAVRDAWLLRPQGQAGADQLAQWIVDQGWGLLELVPDALDAWFVGDEP